MLIEAREWRKRNGKENWEEFRTQVLKHFPGAEESKRGKSKGDVKSGAAAVETVKKGRQGH